MSFPDVVNVSNVPLFDYVWSLDCRVKSQRSYDLKQTMRISPYSREFMMVYASATIRKKSFHNITDHTLRQTCIVIWTAGVFSLSLITRCR